MAGWGRGRGKGSVPAGQGNYIILYYSTVQRNCSIVDTHKSKCPDHQWKNYLSKMLESQCDGPRNIRNKERISNITYVPERERERERERNRERERQRERERERERERA